MALTSSITIVTDEVGKNDETLVIDTHHPNIPDDISKQLRESQTDVRYKFELKKEMDCTHYIVDIR